MFFTCIVLVLSGEVSGGVAEANFLSGRRLFLRPTKKVAYGYE